MATSTAFGSSALALFFLAGAPHAVGAGERGGDGPAPECRYCPVYSGASGWGEVGIGYQDESSAPFGRYTGHEDDGFHGVVNGRVRYRGQGAGYVEAEADDLGLDSRRLYIEGGAQGRYGLALEYDEIPNHRDRTSFSPFRGDSRLVLPQNWVPGANANSLPTLGRDLRRIPLETQRDRLGAAFKLLPRKDWEVFGHFRREEKEGTQDMGATFGFGQTVILPAPVDYETDDFALGFSYSGDALQVRVAYDGSIFRNEDDAVSWQNPFVGAGANTGTGLMAGAPDNEHHQLSAMLGYALGEATRLDAKLALGRMTQDDDFLPYTSNSNPLLTVHGGLPANSAASLPAADLDGEVETMLVEARITSRPLPRLRLNADFTYSDRDNDSERQRWDRVVTDQVNPPGLTRFNTPYGFTQNLARFKAAYRLPRGIEVQGGLEYDRMERSFQAVEETEDTKVWTRLGFRPTDAVQAAFKLSHAERDASAYRPVAHVTAFNEIQNPGLRIHNLADRDRDSMGGSATWAMTPAVTLAVDFDFYRDDYDDTQVGLQEASGRLVSFDASFRISEGLSASAFFTNDRLESDQAGQAFRRFDWFLTDRYNTDTYGLGVNWTPAGTRLDLAADLTHSAFWGEIDYTGTSAAGNLLQDYPDLETDVTTLNLRGRYRLDARQSLVFRLRYEHYDEKDWAKDGIVNTTPTLLDLGRDAFDDEAVMASVAYRYRFD